MSDIQLLIVTIFVSYFVLHSLTASLWLKQRVASCCPNLMPYYRLLFNTLATLLAVPLLYLAWRYPGVPLWSWQGTVGYVADAVGLLALLALLYSLRLYDMSEFAGFRQARSDTREIGDQEHFRISTFHRYVRHPWYFLILLILWSRDMSSNQLLIYSLVTLYLVIGSRLEERKLIAYHGPVYEAYRRRVAGLLPLPWKTLTRREAASLLAQHRH